MNSVSTLISLVEAIERLPDTVCQEDRLQWRADQVRITDNDLELKILEALSAHYPNADFNAYGEITGLYDPIRQNFSLCDENISLVLSKTTNTDVACFLRSNAFGQFLQAWPVISPKLVRIGDIETGFLTEAFTVASWDEIVPHREPKSFLSPRRLVRDQTSSFTPLTLAPWLTPTPRESLDASEALTIWKNAAAQRLAYVIPSEVREIDGAFFCILKGPRSTPIEIHLHHNSELDFHLLQDTAEWIYSSAKDAESKFSFINYHLSLDWVSSRSWLEGLSSTLQNSLDSAKDAFSFYLQDQGKDALKSLADLRKSLQEEVGKTQTAIKDTIGAVWRDFALAAVVLVLKTPIADISGQDFHIETIEIATAILLSFSAVVNIWAIRSFIKANNTARAEWRPKIYAFVTDRDWQRLVEDPLAKSRGVLSATTYGAVSAYVLSVSYLIYLASVATIGFPFIVIFLFIFLAAVLLLILTRPLSN